MKKTLQIQTGLSIVLLIALLAVQACVPRSTPLPKELKRSVWINPEVEQIPVRTYLILPFETSHAETGVTPSAESAVARRLRDQGYTVLTRAQIIASLKANPLAKLKFTDEEAARLARDLGADVVVRGLISDLQVNLEATEVEGGRKLWRASEPFKLPIGDHSTVLSSDLVLSTIKRLIRTVSGHLPDAPSDSIEAPGNAPAP